MNPDVSVIMAAYNCGPYIEQAMRSVVGQTWPNLELVVVDDGSTDETRNIIERLANEDPRIRVFHQPNSGRPSIARNVGLRQAKGRYICFLDADDFYVLDRIELLRTEMDKQPDWVAVFHDLQLVDQDGQTPIRTYLKDSKFLEDASPWIVPLGGLWYECSSAFFHFMSLRYGAVHTATILLDTQRVPVDQIRFDEQLVICEDTDFWIRIGMLGKMGYCDRVLSTYRQNEHSITRNQERFVRETIKLHQMNYCRMQAVFSPAELNLYRRKISHYFFALGYQLADEAGRISEARRAYLSALRWSPQIITAFALMKTVIPRSVKHLWRKSAQRTGQITPE